MQGRHAGAEHELPTAGTATMYTLDAMYGEAIDAQPRPRRKDGSRFSRCEMLHTPRSRYKLTRDSGVILNTVMDAIKRGWQIGHVVFFDVIIIWLVDEYGDIWFAIEELVIHDRPTGHPNHAALAIQQEDDRDKLGHSSLINCKRGRIGGQIYLDTKDEPLTWVIDNYSGRYGVHPRTKVEHLRNAAQRFEDDGVQLVIDDSFFFNGDEK